MQLAVRIVYVCRTCNTYKSWSWHQYLNCILQNDCSILHFVAIFRWTQEVWVDECESAEQIVPDPLYICYVLFCWVANFLNAMFEYTGGFRILSLIETSLGTDLELKHFTESCSWNMFLQLLDQFWLEYPKLTWFSCCDTLCYLFCADVTLYRDALCYYKFSL